MFGHILRVDLAKQQVSVEPTPIELRRKYVGGEGINSWLLWEHFLRADVRADPTSPQNVLIAGVGPLAGLGFGGTKMKWTFKSPAYDLFGDSSSGGNFPASLRRAGYDHLVITGRASHPVYLWINDDRVEIRDAAHLWGRGTREADDLIKEELGNEGLETACIGRGGENGVGYASLIVSRHRAAGRCGAGCVMGSKNLKAIAVKGTRGLRLHDPKGFAQTVLELLRAAERFPKATDGWRRHGTISGTSFYQTLGVNSFRNNQYCTLPEDKLEMLGHRWFAQNLTRGGLSCSPGCILSCGGWYRIKGDETPSAGRFAGKTGRRPEFGGGAAFGIMCDIPDWTRVIFLVDLCNEYGLDVIEVGACCAFLMELWQRGILNERDMVELMGEPLSLEWGNEEAVVKIIRSMAAQEDALGRILRRGVYRAAREIEEIKGTPVLPYALYGKGGSAFIEDIRNTPSWATNMAVASRGCDHLKGLGTLDKVLRPDISELYFGRPDAAQTMSTTLKGASSALAENRCAMLNSLGVCLFVVAADPISFSPDLYSRALEAATGLALSPPDLLRAGERTVNLEKAFNSRLGLRREDDRMCERWMKEPMPEGVGKGWKAEDYIEDTKDEYYDWHGWDRESSLQTRRKLEELDMKDVADVLAEGNALV